MSTVSMKARLNKKYVEANRSTYLYLMVELITKEKEQNSERLPLNLGFVIDRSGSMGGEKLAYTKQAVNYAINHLATPDYASLTVYDNEVDVLVESQPATNKDQFRNIVNQIFCGGCTNLSGGLVKGYREVMKHYEPEKVNRVLLMTDGLANEGITDKSKLCRKVQEMKNTGVSVTTLGVGEDFDEDLLTAMAEASGGNYFFIDSTEKIPKVFAQEMQALLSVVAQNVKLGFCSTANSRVTKVWGYQPIGDSEISINLPDLYSSDRKVIVMELQVSEAKEGSMPIGSVTVSYDDAEADLKFDSYTFDLAVECTSDQALLGKPEDGEVMVNVELNRTAELKEEAIKKADTGDIIGAAQLMEKQRDILACCEENCVDAEYAQELREEVGKLNESLRNLQRENFDAITRKKMAYQSYQRRSNQKDV